MEKYEYVVKIRWTGYVEGKNEKDAKQQLIEEFAEETVNISEMNIVLKQELTLNQACAKELKKLTGKI